MPIEQNARLQKTLWDLQKKYGDRSVGLLVDIVITQGIRTSFPKLDQALSHTGIVHNRLTLLVSHSLSSGMTTLTHRIIAQAQREAPVVYVDGSGTLDVDTATHYGVALDRLLIVEIFDPIQALSVVRDILSTACASLIVVDMAVETAMGPQLSTLLKRALEPLNKSQCALLFLVSDRAPILPTLEGFADTLIVLHRRDWLRRGTDVTGYSVEVTVREKERPVEQHVLLEIELNSAIDGDV